jgi:crotonobetainyl-CoA:carnitine CoA-transferase CaiB-like acyl-CoA transferase
VPCEHARGDAALDLWKEEKLVADELVASYDHRMVGHLGHPGLACQFSDTKTSVQGAPLLVGEHSRELLASLGFDEDRIDSLFEAGCVGDETIYPALAKDPSKVAASPWDPKTTED